jgi:phenylpyruvate tautomerase PptA (4-oxalocrotonate tautomerase family)
MAYADRMPLVRIDLRKGRPGFGTRVGAVVFHAMRATLNVPEKDHFQVITEHDPHGLVYDPEYLGIKRTDDVLLIQITLNHGRTLETKKAFYQTLVERLHAELEVRREDVLVSLVEVAKENWSFGNGVASYA